MAVKCDEYNHIGVLTVEGDFTADNAAALKKLVEERMVGRQLADFVVDLEKCSFVDSEGLETLLWLKRRCEELFGAAKLATLDENCRKILEITRLEHRFDCHKDVPGALKNMR